MLACISPVNEIISLSMRCLPLTDVGAFSYCEGLKSLKHKRRKGTALHLYCVNLKARGNTESFYLFTGESSSVFSAVRPAVVS